MLAKILLLSTCIFSIIYPLSFWISYQNPLKNNFHKFHLGLSNVTAGLTLVALFLMKIPMPIIWVAIVWKLFLLGISQFYWKKPSPNPFVLTIASLMGIYTFILLHQNLVGKTGGTEIFIWLLSGLIFCSSLFAMNLGHWYLNVHGLPIEHLRRSMYVLAFFLFVRLIWDIFILITGKILYLGESVPLIQFIGRLDGFLLCIPLFFGTLFPFISIYFVKGTLDVKNTQSATGILYVVLTSILLGDIAYKYYLIKFGIAL